MWAIDAPFRLEVEGFGIVSLNVLFPPRQAATRGTWAPTWGLQSV
jgi:hypothetical protein